jgi:hypothetical protein
MGAGGFHGRVRDGIGCGPPAMTTRSSNPPVSAGLLRGAAPRRGPRRLLGWIVVLVRGVCDWRCAGLMPTRIGG